MKEILAAHPSASRCPGSSALKGQAIKRIWLEAAGLNKNLQKSRSPALI